MEEQELLEVRLEELELEKELLKFALEERKFEEAFVNRELVKALTSPLRIQFRYTTAEVAVILGIDKHIALAHRKGFLTTGEHHKYRLEKRGFSSQAEYDRYRRSLPKEEWY